MFVVVVVVADIEIANKHGHTCLMIACYKKHFKIAKYLLSIGADVNRKSSKGNTALHDCAESGSLEILQLLISYGAKMDVDSYGEFERFVPPTPRVVTTNSVFFLMSCVSMQE